MKPNEGQEKSTMDMSEMAARSKEVAELLKVLANEHRLLILCTLLPGPMSVNEINSAVDSIGQSALSQHLAKLKALGLLSSEKQGQHVYYKICDHRVEKLLAVLKETYCTPTT